MNGGYAYFLLLGFFAGIAACSWFYHLAGL